MTIGCSVLPSTLRARIEGAVVRLPGTGEGVARLVAVSMVKVDIGAASSGRDGKPPIPDQAPATDNDGTGPVPGCSLAVHEQAKDWEDESIRLDPCRRGGDVRSRHGAGAAGRDARYACHSGDSGNSGDTGRSVDRDGSDTSDPGNSGHPRYAGRFGDRNGRGHDRFSDSGRFREEEKEQEAVYGGRWHGGNAGGPLEAAQVGTAAAAGPTAS